MKCALLGDKKFLAEELTHKDRWSTFTCHTCGNQLFPVVVEDSSTYNFFRHKPGESCIPYESKIKYSQEEFEEFEKTSDVNALLTCGGNLGQLTWKQRKQLRRRGLIRIRGCYRMELTNEALELLERRR